LLAQTTEGPHDGNADRDGTQNAHAAHHQHGQLRNCTTTMPSAPPGMIVTNGDYLHQPPTPCRDQPFPVVVDGHTQHLREVDVAALRTLHHGGCRRRTPSLRPCHDVLLCCCTSCYTPTAVAPTKPSQTPPDLLPTAGPSPSTSLHPAAVTPRCLLSVSGRP
jgi:hypothetical protein